MVGRLDVLSKEPQIEAELKKGRWASDVARDLDVSRAYVARIKKRLKDKGVDLPPRQPRGVTQIDGRWRVRFERNGQTHYGGRYATREEAEKAAIELHKKLDEETTT